LAVYRCRWQIALAIKRWKSVLDVDALRAKACSPLAEVWLHGKVLSVLMLERRMRRTLGDRWGRWDQDRVGTWWRVWAMLKEAIAPLITGALFWPPERVSKNQTGGVDLSRHEHTQGLRNGCDGERMATTRTVSTGSQTRGTTDHVSPPGDRQCHLLFATHRVLLAVITA